MNFLSVLSKSLWHIQVISGTVDLNVIPSSKKPLRENRRSGMTYFTYGCELNPIRTLHYHCPIRVKACMTNLHINLLIIHGFDDRCTEALLVFRK